MEPFDSLEKLISERGSAQVLRDRIGLIQEQYSGLERENKRLKVENINLREDNVKLVKANEELKKAGRTTVDSLGGDEEKVLALLAKMNSYTSIGFIQQTLGLSEVKTEYCVGVLEEKYYVKNSGINFSDVETTYCVTHEGRKYAITNGLVK